MRPHLPLLLILLFLSSGAHATLIFSDDQATFDPRWVSMSTEDFSGATFGDSVTARVLSGPVDSTSIFFSPRLVEGLVISTAPQMPNDLFLGRGGASDRISNAIGIEQVVPSGGVANRLRFGFTDGADALAFSLYAFLFESDPMLVQVFGESGKLIGEHSAVAGSAADPGFLGIQSDDPDEEIFAVELSRSGTGSVNVYGVTFGHVPEPGTALLVGVGLALLGGGRSRRNAHA